MWQLTGLPECSWRPLVAGLLGLMLSACGGGGGNVDSGDPVGSVSGIRLNGAVVPDPLDLTAEGAHVKAKVYLVGQEDKAVETDESGNFSLDVSLRLSSVVTSKLTEKVRAAMPAADRYGLVVISSDQGYGRKTEVTIRENETPVVSTIYVNSVGSIAGKVTLQDSVDHTGTRVYIPGTSFSATTAADGSFAIGNVPAGTYDFLRAEKDGYRYSVISDVTVRSKQSTQVTDQQLLLSTGPTGQVLINSGTGYATSRTVPVNIAATEDAVLMMLSENAFFSNTEWRRIATATEFTFSNDGQNQLWVRFADANGLESSSFSSAPIFIDSTPSVGDAWPESASTVDNTLPSFSWSANPAVPDGSYRFQLASESTFASPLVDTTVSTVGHTLTAGNVLTNGNTYYWRVAIVQGGKQWNWGGPWSFSVDPGRVSLVAPPESAITDTGPVLDWTDSPVTGATYRLQVASDAAFTQVVEDRADLTASMASPTTPLPDDAVYYWRVAVVDGNGVQGDWTGTRSFQVRLGMVTPYSPSGVITNSRPTLNWTASDIAGVRYRVQLASDQLFGAPIVDTTTAAGELSYGLSSPLEIGINYYARVAVLDGNGVQGAWSPATGFTIDTGAVSLLSPSHLGTTSDTLPTLDWSDSTVVANAVYRIQVATDVGFSAMHEQADTSAGTSTWSLSQTLSDGVTYFWRVAVVDGNGALGQFSETHSFTVDMGSLTLSTPTDGSTIGDTRPELQWQASGISGVSYDVQVDTSSSFASPAAQATGLSGTTYTVGNTLSDNTTYYWRVRVLDGNGVYSRWSGSGIFQVDIGTVDLSGPSDGIYTNDTTPLFTWSSNANAASYELLLGTSPDLSGAGSHPVTAAGSTESFALDPPLPGTARTTWYWAVTPLDANGVAGTRSAVRSFVLDTVAPTGSVTINEGASSTGYESVMLTLSASDTGGTGVVSMATSTDDTTFSSASFSAEQEFTFSAFSAVENGTMTAYVRYTDAAGNQSNSVTDTIALARSLKSGHITGNETWTTAGAPYVIAENLVVDSVATLTIEPGVDVRFNPNTAMLVYGTLIADGADGVTTSPVTITSNRFRPAPGDWGYIELAGGTATYDMGGGYTGGPILRNAIVEYGGYTMDYPGASEAMLRVNGSSPFITQSVLRHSSAVALAMGAGTVTHNLIYGNAGYHTVYLDWSDQTFHNNVVCGNASQAGGVFVDSLADLQYNQICNHTNPESTLWGSGLHVKYTDSTTVSYNTVTGVRGGQGAVLYEYWSSTAPVVMGNSVLGNGSAYGLVWMDTGDSQGSSTFEVVNNYWGDSTASGVNAAVGDFADNTGWGVATYNPWLNVPNTSAPVSPPQNLAVVPTAGGALDVSWQAGTEADLAGYVVYWDIDSGPPYANEQTVTGSTATTLSGLIGGQSYYVTVVAYDSGASAVTDDANTAINEKQTSGTQSWYAVEQQVTAMP